MRSSVIVAVLLLAPLAPVRSLAATQQPDPAIPLRGLPGVFVVIQDLDPATGLVPEQVRRDVEQWIREAGVRTLTREQFSDAKGHPVLNVYIDVLEPSEVKGLVLFDVRLAVYESVLLQRASATWLMASTWDVGLGLSYADRSLATEALRQGTRQLVDKFAEAYKEANAATASAPTKPPAAAPPVNPPTAPASSSPPGAVRPAAPARGQAQAAKAPTTGDTDPKRVVAAARSIAIKQHGSTPELETAVERQLQAWSRFSVVSDESGADLILDVTPSGGINQESGKTVRVTATLTTRNGDRLWSTTKETDTSDEGDAFPKTAEAIVQELRSFVGR